MNRRKLDLRDLDAVLADVRQLASDGYERVGDWTLGQICEHCARPMDSCIDGFPVQLNVFIRVVGRWLIKPRMFKSRSIPAGLKAPGVFTEDLGSVDDAAGVLRLEQAVGRLQAHDGPWQPSPVVGPLDKSGWLEFHTIHCMHHLSFLQPRS